MAFFAFYGIEIIFYGFVVSNCLFVTNISRGNLLGSCEEKLTFNKIIVHRKGKWID